MGGQELILLHHQQWQLRLQHNHIIRVYLNNNINHIMDGPMLLPPLRMADRPPTCHRSRACDSRATIVTDFNITRLSAGLCAAIRGWLVITAI
jgi:hypothetical protein